MHKLRAETELKASSPVSSSRTLSNTPTSSKNSLIPHCKLQIIHFDLKNDIFCIHQVFLLIKSFWYFLHILYLSYKSTWLNYMPHVSGRKRRLSPKLSISYFSHHWPWFRISKELALFKRIPIYLFFGCAQFSLVAHGISTVVVGLCVWGGGATTLFL